MTRPKSDLMNGTDSGTPPGEVAGLQVRGEVLRRWRKVLDTGTEVVYYDVSGATVQQYRTEEDYFAVGKFVILPVNC